MVNPHPRTKKAATQKGQTKTLRFSCTPHPAQVPSFLAKKTVFFNVLTGVSGAFSHEEFITAGPSIEVFVWKKEEEKGFLGVF